MIQHDFALHRLARDVAGSPPFSQIDRMYMYTSLHPSAREDVYRRVAVKRGWEQGEAASDNHAVSFCVSLRSALGRRRNKSYVVNHTGFEEVCAEEEILTREVVDFGTRYDSIVSSAFAAQRRILPGLGAGTAGGPHHVADRCLAGHCASQLGDEGHAIDIASDVSELQRYVVAGMVRCACEKPFRMHCTAPSRVSSTSWRRAQCQGSRTRSSAAGSRPAWSRAECGKQRFELHGLYDDHGMIRQDPQGGEGVAGVGARMVADLLCTMAGG